MTAATHSSLFDRIIGAPVAVRMRSPHGITECQRRLEQRFDRRWGRWGPLWNVRDAWAIGPERKIAGRIDGDRIKVMLTGRRQTDLGPMSHTSLPVLRGRLTPDGTGAVLEGEIGDTSYTRVMVRLWFGGLLFLFLPIGVLIVIFNPAQRLVAIPMMLFFTFMLGFGVGLMRWLRWFRDADGRDLAKVLAAAIDADLELPAATTGAGSALKREKEPR